MSDRARQIVIDARDGFLQASQVVVMHLIKLFDVSVCSGRKIKDERNG